MSDLLKAVIDDALPQGPIWIPAPDEDFDKLLDGMSDNHEAVRTELSVLSQVREPLTTPILSDLERDFGIPTDLNVSETVRRTRLHEKKYGRSGNGTEEDMQSALRGAGFDVFVYQNDPAVDPAQFLDQNFQMVAGGDNAYAGRDDAFAGILGGFLLVNGDIFETTRSWTSVAGGGLYAGGGHGAGEYTDLVIEKIEYKIPTQPQYWPLIFFVGGAVTRDGSGAITDIEQASVDSERQDEFKRIILSYKPIQTWAAVIVNFD